LHRLNLGPIFSVRSGVVQAQWQWAGTLHLHGARADFTAANNSATQPIVKNSPRVPFSGRDEGERLNA
jgi:hypothetical protein